jgi:hypothetical protein
MPLVRAAFLAVVWLLAALAPGVARAHGGHEHPAGAAAPLPVLAASAEAAPPCLPGSGHVCGCGNLAVCEARTQASVAAAPVLVFQGLASWPRIASAGAAPFFPKPSASPPSPRAPPSFS